MTAPAIDFAALRADRAELVRELESAGAVFKGNDCRCPFHDDKTASAGVYESEGAWRFKCQAAGCGLGGDVLDVRAKLAGTDRATETRRLADAQYPGQAKRPEPDKPPPRIHPTLDALRAAAERSDADKGGGLVKHAYHYRRSATEAPYLTVLRLERPDGSKTFRQASAGPDGQGFIMRAPATPWPVYSLPRVQHAETVIVCEGEKAAGAVYRAGYVATTSAGGAGKAGNTDWTPLAGKTVYLWPDADPVDPKTGMRTGIVHMEAVAGLLKALPVPPKEILWIDPDALDLPPKGDAADFVERHGADAGELLAEVLRQALTLGPLAELDAVLADAKAGRRFAVPMPWPMLSRQARALLPGTVTMYVGSPGATKSLSLVQMVRFWNAEGFDSAALMLEDGSAYHMRRALAQIAGNSNLQDDDWCRENPDKVDDARARYRADLESLHRCIVSLPDSTRPTPDVLTAWIERQCEAGKRVLAIDPITFMVRGRSTWVEDESFLTRAKPTLEKYGASLVLVTHPQRRPVGARTAPPSLDDLAGGTAYQRFSQTVLYLRSHELTPATVKTSAGTITQDHNRTITVLKARNGKGVEGQSFACRFDGGSLLLSELGQIEENN